MKTPCTITKFLLFNLVFVVLSLSVWSQSNSFASAYESKTIFQYGNSYLLNKQKVRYKELEGLLTKYDASGSEYKQYHRLSSQSGLLALLMLGCYITAATQANKNEHLAAGLFAAGAIANIIAIPISGSARKHMQKAVWFYNRDVLR